jgi:hypothetical protein
LCWLVPLPMRPEAMMQPCSQSLRPTSNSRPLSSRTHTYAHAHTHTRTHTHTHTHTHTRTHMHTHTHTHSPPTHTRRSTACRCPSAPMPKCNRARPSPRCAPCARCWVWQNYQRTAASRWVPASFHVGSAWLHGCMPAWLHGCTGHGGAVLRTLLLGLAKLPEDCGLQVASRWVSA